MDEDYCTICLQPQHGTFLGMGETNNPKQLNNFQPIIHYLIGTDPSHDKSDEEYNELGIPVMESLPPMCPPCYDILAELYQLHQQLLNIQILIQKQTELAREVIAKALIHPSKPSNRRSSPREQFHSRNRSSGLSAAKIVAVRKLLHDLHDKASAEGMNAVRFPISVPISVQDDDDDGNDESVVAEVDNVETRPVEEQNIYIKTEDEDEEMSADFDNLMNEIEDVAFSPSPPEVSSESDNELAPVEPSHQQSSPSFSSLKRTSQLGSRPGLASSKISKSGVGTKHILTDDCKKKTNIRSATSNSRKPIMTSKSSSANPPAVELKRDPNGLTIRRLARPPQDLPQNCDICGKMFPSSLKMRLHLELQHGVNAFITKCPNSSCPFVFSCPRKMEIHLRYGTGDDKHACLNAAKLPLTPPPGKCEVCHLDAVTLQGFYDHLQEHESTMQDKSFRCPIKGCLEKFAIKQSLGVHLPTHAPKPPKVKVVREKRKRIRRRKEFVRRHNCDLCGEPQTITEMVGHLEGHQVKEYITRCPFPNCGRFFPCQAKMEYHLRRIHKHGNQQIPFHFSTTFKCETCSLEVGRLPFRLHLHGHESQNKDKSIPCPIPDCSERYALRQSVDQHIMTHDLTPKTEQTCPVCKELFKTEDIGDHFREAHDSKELTPCKRCPFTFPNWEHLLDHLYDHHQSASTGLSCDLCDDTSFKYFQYESLRQHYFNIHNLGLQYICEHCHKQFFAHRTLSNHIQKAHSINDGGEKVRAKPPPKKHVKCDLCPETSFYSTNDLRTHKMRVHGAPPVACQVCSETFTSIEKLQRHERAHAGVKRRYKCSVANCGRVFSKLTMWREHEQWNHEPGSKPFICETCGKGFDFSGILKMHVKKFHLGKIPERPTCEICGESFATAHTLRRHNLIHTGERPFQCTICGQAFRHGDVLKTHLKGHEEKGESFKPNGPMKNLRKRCVKE